MIADVADRPGALPLLQYALTELAERADDARSPSTPIGASAGSRARSRVARSGCSNR